MNNILNDKRTLNQIYDILVEKCGAYEDYREQFLDRITNRHIVDRVWSLYTDELGKSGEFRLGNDYWYVFGPSADYTPERERLIYETNQKLQELKGKFDSIATPNLAIVEFIRTNIEDEEVVRDNWPVSYVRDTKDAFLRQFNGELSHHGKDLKLAVLTSKYNEEYLWVLVSIEWEGTQQELRTRLQRMFDEGMNGEFNILSFTRPVV